MTGDLVNDDERMAHINVGVYDWMYAAAIRAGKCRFDMERGRREKVRGVPCVRASAGGCW